MRFSCFYQRRLRIFAFFAVALLLGGCRPSEPRPVNLLNMDLLCDALQRLEDDCGETAEKPLQRLHDSLPEQPFPVLALAHANERLAALELNRALAVADLKTAAAMVEAWAAGSGAPAALPKARRLIQALISLQAVQGQIPFSDSETAAAALATLNPDRPVLRLCPEFELWLAAQNAALESLRAEEKATVLRQLWQSCDVAIVGETRDPELLFAEIRALDPEHSGLQAVELAAGAHWPQFAELAVSTALRPGVEAGICMYWKTIPENIRQELRVALESEEPASLCGVLARCLLNDEVSRDSLESLRAVAALVPFGSDRVRDLLQQLLLPASQFRAVCWRAPVPAVSDLLHRLSQLREREFRRPGAWR